jgi:hypothetical protein
MTEIERIQNDLDKGYTVAKYGNTKALHEQMLKDIKYLNDLAKNNESLHDVGVREFECDDVVCTNDGKMWVITEIDGNDLLVTGNGKKYYPLEKSDITHAH